MLNMTKNIIIASALILPTFASQAANLCGQVWSGEVERVRVQQQSNGDVLTKIYIYPGNNADYVGYTASQTFSDALFKAQQEGKTIKGYSDSSCVIKWVDFE